jgi:Tfp pilus assembly protein PilX
MKSIKHNGFVILFAVIISVLMLLLGAGIFSIASKDSILSSTSREAHMAFTAADTGAECALYAVSTGTYFIQGSLDTVVPCADSQIIFAFDGTDTWEGNLVTSASQRACSIVSIQTTPAQRTIRAQGFNLCNNDQPQSGNPLLVERVLELTYQIGGIPMTQGQGSQNTTQGGSNNQGMIQQGNQPSQIPLDTTNVPKVTGSGVLAPGVELIDPNTPLKVVQDPDCIPTAAIAPAIRLGSETTDSMISSSNTLDNTNLSTSKDEITNPNTSSVSSQASSQKKLSTGVRTNNICDDAAQKSGLTNSRLQQASDQPVDTQVTEQSGLQKVLTSVSETFESTLSIANQATQSLFNFFK